MGMHMFDGVLDEVPTVLWGLKRERDDVVGMTLLGSGVDSTFKELGNSAHA